MTELFSILYAAFILFLLSIMGVIGVFSPCTREKYVGTPSNVMRIMLFLVALTCMIEIVRQVFCLIRFLKL
jgi:hypothetical protein